MQRKWTADHVITTSNLNLFSYKIAVPFVQIITYSLNVTFLNKNKYSGYEQNYCYKMYFDSLFFSYKFRNRSQKIGDKKKKWEVN